MLFCQESNIYTHLIGHRKISVTASRSKIKYLLLRKVWSKIQNLSNNVKLCL